MSVRIGINAHAVALGIGGIETYVRNVIRGLGRVDPDGDYTLFVNPGLPHDAFPGAKRMRRVDVQPNNVFVRNLVTFPLALAREHIDVVHVQYAAPPLCPGRIVVTVHDLIYERYPQFYTREARLQFRIAGLVTIRRASAILADSQFVKQEIVRRYCVPPDKITVVNGGPDPSMRVIHDVGRLAEVRSHYGTGEHFILYVGNLEPRKNLRTLIAAYVRLRQVDATRHKLVIVGRKAWLYDDIFVAARTSGYGDDLVFTGYVPDEDVVALYNAADLFVYPSIAEGLGLPPLEAMACGTPVVTSNTSSLPEVTGGAAVLVDPLDVEGLAGAIARVLGDAELQAQLRSKGLERVKHYSWDEAARLTRDVYYRVAM